MPDTVWAVNEVLLEPQPETCNRTQTLTCHMHRNDETRNLRTSSSPFTAIAPITPSYIIPPVL